MNFDQEILQLIREAKILDRMGIEIPESAKIALFQVTKYFMEPKLFPEKTTCNRSERHAILLTQPETLVILTFAKTRLHGILERNENGQALLVNNAHHTCAPNNRPATSSRVPFCHFLETLT